MHKASAQPSYLQRPAYHTMLLGGIAMLASSLLVLGELETRDAIAARQAEDLTANLSQVIASELHDNSLLEDVLVLNNTKGQPVTFYRARMAGEVAAVAFQMSGPGYAGDIDCLLGVKADGSLLGVRVLAHAETPGLGDKIEVARDDWILAFDGKSLGNPSVDKWGVKKDGGIFDQFTGATITPRGVVQAVREGLELFAAHKDALMQKVQVEEETTEKQ